MNDDDDISTLQCDYGFCLKWFRNIMNKNFHTSNYLNRVSRLISVSAHVYLFIVS